MHLKYIILYKKNQQHDIILIGDSMDINMFMIQLIGGIAYCLLAISYFSKNKKKILAIQILSYAGFTIHYYLLDAKTGAMCNFIGLIIFLIIYAFSNNKSKNKEKILLMITVPALVIIASLTYQDIFSIFPIVASVIATISFLSDDEDKIRFIGIISAICWLIYALVADSYVTIIFEIIIIPSTIIAFIKNKKTI